MADTAPAAASPNAVLRTLGKYKITGADVLAHLRINIELEPLIRVVAVKRLVRDHAQQLGLKVSDAELQTAADGWRRRNGLFRAKDTFKFLELLKITVDEFEQDLETGLLTEKLRDHLFGKKVKGWFVENQANFEEVELRHLVVANQAKADELRAQLVEDRVPFAKLAKEHSLDKTTKRNGGYLGWVRRGIQTPEIETQIFNGKVGSVLGPFKVMAGFELVEVLDKKAAEYTDEVREQVLSHLFQTEFVLKHLPPPDLDLK